MRRNLLTFHSFIFRDLLKLKKNRNPLLPVDIRFDVFEEKWNFLNMTRKQYIITYIRTFYIFFSKRSKIFPSRTSIMTSFSITLFLLHNLTHIFKILFSRVTLSPNLSRTLYIFLLKKFNSRKFSLFITHNTTSWNDYEISAELFTLLWTSIVHRDISEKLTNIRFSQAYRLFW